MASSSVIVIGAGINGLVAAAELGSQGKKVIVLERANTPGGSIRTLQMTLPGFHHDIGAMNLSAFAGSGFMQKHRDAMSRHGLEFVHADRPFAQALSPGDHLGISTNIDETLSTINSAADRETWKALLSGFADRSSVLFRLLGSPVRPSSLAALAWFSIRKLGVNGSLDLARLLISSPRGWLNDTFEDPRLRSALSSWGMHLDYSPDIAGGAIFPYLEGIGGQAHGMVMPKGGAGKAIEALVSMIESQGGEVRCNTDVVAIEHLGSKVTGVVTHKGVLPADTVLACVAPRNLMKLVGRTDTPDFDKGMQKFQYGPGTMMVHLALNGPVPWASRALKDFAYVHIGRSIDTASLTYSQALSGLLPAEPILVVGQPTVYDPTRAPEGKHVLWVQVRVLPSEIRGDAKGEIKQTSWAYAKDAMADRVLNLIEEQAPGFRSVIAAMKIVSPEDLENMNPNLVGGDQVGGSHHLSQNFIFRPMRGYADGTTPIKGLHLIGASTWPGAGSAGGSGFLKAQSLG